MTRQTVHKRISKKGMPFTAGSKPIPAPKLKADTILMVANMPYLKKLLMPVFNLIPEFRVLIGYGSMYITEMDPANVTCLDYKIHNHNGISIRSLKPIKLSISSNTFKNSIKDIRKNIPVEFQLRGNEKLLLITQNMKAEIPLLDTTGNKEVKLPDLKTKFAMVMNAQAFLDALKNLSTFANEVILESGPKGITLTAHGDVSSNTITLDSSKMESSKAKYGLEYLMKLSPILTKENMVRLKWATDYPIIVTVESQGFEISMILAPRVEND